MVARAITRHYNAILAPLELEITEFSLLASLALERDASITQLAGRLAFERTTLVRNLKRLDRRGLIENQAARGRAIRYVLTPTGQDRLAEALPLWHQAQATIESRLEPGDRESVGASLKKLYDATRDAEGSRTPGPTASPVKPSLTRARRHRARQA